MGLSGSGVVEEGSLLKSGWLPGGDITEELSDGELVRASSDVWTTELEIRWHRSVPLRQAERERR